MKKHSKLKGNIAESAAILRLTSLGYSVFREIGDLSKVDLIAEKDCKIITFQVKGVTPKKGVIPLSLKKSGPNYRFRYEEGMFDYFAVVNLDTLEVAFVPSEVLKHNKSNFTLRVEKPKHNEVCNMFKDYMSFSGTSETIRATRKWEDIVQTTSESATER